MSHAFRNLLRKIGSGPQTGENLTRPEAALATRLMLLQEATPAQIGAFMIAHRIRRPTGEELAGMLDAYEELGPMLTAIAAQPVLVLGIPYDGRTRTAPIAPLTALILATAGQPVLMHGGDRMPTKGGDPLILFWQGLGVNWTQLSLSQVQPVFEQTGIGFVYLPTHFPLAQGLVPYREQIGKRPPFATMELMWCPYAGNAHVVSGFVHPPTEAMFQTAFALRGIDTFTTVKGLEGSCDLPRERTAIVGLGRGDQLERLHLHPRDFQFEAKNVALDSVEHVIRQMKDALDGHPSEFMQSVLWNGGFYLWRCGVSPSVEAGIADAERLLMQGQVKQTLQTLRQAMAPMTVSGV
ncbi:MAG: anthranilate phosphoribosyltransferase family protein [Oscillatoriales cyanobacterium C42_A2020_001]|nr:anthranilate phosphoribosyltransferase family protein [Leptolyngbyaceae cyanobacterium C42_A2020_001]